jgi:ubiquinone/menaquinone biosynthesis C-methylase UbiE
VITRYSFHHFIEPEKVLAEMYRVCKPNGKILIADVVLPKDKVENFDVMERLRDNSHTKALTFEQFDHLLESYNLKNLKRADYEVQMELENQLRASFPKEGDTDKIRTIFKEDLVTNKMGINTRLVEGEIHFSYPISIYVGEK